MGNDSAKIVRIQLVEAPKSQTKELTFFLAMGEVERTSGENIFLTPLKQAAFKRQKIGSIGLMDMIG